MKRLESRGYSILAALVFVAILSGVTFAVQSFSPASGSMSLVNSASQAAATDSTTQVKEDKKEVKLEASDGNTRCNAPITQKKGPKEGREGVESVCVPGCIYNVIPSKDGSNPKVVATDDCKSLPAGTVAEKNAKQKCEKERPCKVLEGSKTHTGNAADQVLGKAAQIPEYLKNEKEIQDALAKLKQGENIDTILKDQPSWIKDAFQEAKDTDLAKQNDALAKNLADKESVDRRLQNAIANGSNDRIIENIQNEQRRLEADRARLLDEQSKLLAANISNLDPANNPVLRDPSNIDNVDVSCGGGLCTAAPRNEADADALRRNGFTCTAVETGTHCQRSDSAVKTPIPKSDPRKNSTFPPPGPCSNGGAPPDCKPPNSTGCTGANCGPGNAGGGGGNSSGGGSSGGGGNPLSALGGLMQGLMKGLGAQKGPPCPSDPAAYQREQQQYQMQMQQYNMQLQQYNYQRQIAQYNGYPAPIEPTAPVACTPGSTTNTCPTAPAQPPADQCPNGTWRPQTTQQTNGRQCTTGWQCAPGTATPPEAELACQPAIADVGMTVAIAYSCANSTTSTGNGFTTAGALSGSTSTVLMNPPANARNANFALTCRNQSLTARAECSVQIARPMISITARPNPVTPGATTTVAWITSGMDSCIVSSAQMPVFTSENAGASRINGTATTPAITEETEVLLTCQTLGGNTKKATTTIRVASSTSATVNVSSTIDGNGAVQRGATTTISWSVTNAPANSAMSLWVVDMESGQSIGLISGQLATSSTYSWTVPSAPSACPVDTPIICGKDIIAGKEYAISAALYTPLNAHLGGYPPQNAVQPQYHGQNRGGIFKLAN